MNHDGGICHVNDERPKRKGVGCHSCRIVKNKVLGWLSEEHPSLDAEVGRRFLAEAASLYSQHLILDLLWFVEMCEEDTREYQM